MRRALMISPHFPPDSGAATHRVRLLAPYMRDFGWEPTVLTVERSAIEGRQDPALEAMVPAHVRVVRAPALSQRWTRKIGFGDLGLRAFGGLYSTASDLLKAERFDVLFITIFPSYPALLGPLLKSRFNVPFVLDYMDPWVGAWGLTVGGGKDGSVDLKSRITRAAALRLEGIAVRAADAITAVSAGTYEMIRERLPEATRIPCTAIPLGGDAADFAHVRQHVRDNVWFDKSDGDFHICYVGTLLPLGYETLRAVLKAVASLRETWPTGYERIRLHFFGTSNQTAGSPDARVLPLARDLGVIDRVSEHPVRVDYLDAIKLQLDASAILLMGSSEHHYTASKLYPALLAGRKIIAVYHEASSVAEIVERVTSPPNAQLITYSDVHRAEDHVQEIADALRSMVENPLRETISWMSEELDKFSARYLACEMGRVFELASVNRSATR